MFDQFHLGHKVSDFNQILMGVAAGQDDMGHLRFVLGQESHYFGNVDIVVSDRNIDLIQQNHVVAFIQDQLFRLGPCGLRHFDIARLVLGLPGEAFSHRVKSAGVLEF